MADKPRLSKAGGQGSGQGQGQGQGQELLPTLKCHQHR